MKDDSSREQAASRRQFLQSATLVGGALVLGHAVKSQAAEGDAPAAPATAETIIKLDEHTKLAAPGGFEIVTVGGDKVIIAHTEAGYAACSAICPHRGCELVYQAAQKQFFCPCHKSSFDESGKVTHGPAHTDLAHFDAKQALFVAKA